LIPARYLSRVATTFRLAGTSCGGSDCPDAQRNALGPYAVVWIWGIILLPFHFADWFGSMQNQIVTDAALVIALVLLRRGRSRWATFTYLGSIWFFATHVMALNGGVRCNVQALYVTLPISAAWLLSYERLCGFQERA
jgi:hypothetical protein